MEFRFPSKPIFFRKLSHTCVGRLLFKRLHLWANVDGKNPKTIGPLYQENWKARNTN